MEQQEEPDLTAAERRKLRIIIVKDDRAAWAASILRAWALWITAVVAGVTVGWEFLKKVAKAMVAP